MPGSSTEVWNVSDDLNPFKVLNKLVGLRLKTFVKLFCKNSSIGGFCSLFSDSVFLKNQHCMQYVQVTGRRPRGRPTAHWRDCVSWLAWVHLSVPSDKLEEVDGLGVLA